MYTCCLFRSDSLAICISLIGCQFVKFREFLFESGFELGEVEVVESSKDVRWANSLLVCILGVLVCSKWES